MAKLSNDRLDKFRPQTRNANKHTQRGMGALEAAMRKYGYVAPMTAAADGEILDGSARIETSASVFGDDAIVVHHDGTKPIIMVRDDIPSADTPEARAISMAANRISQVNLDFDAEVILGDLQAGVDLSQFWQQDELDALMHAITAPPTLDELDDKYGEGGEQDFWPVIKVQISPETKELYDSLWRDAPGTTDDEKFAALLGAVDAAVLGAE